MNNEPHSRQGARHARPAPRLSPATILIAVMAVMLVAAGIAIAVLLAGRNQLPASSLQVAGNANLEVDSNAANVEKLPDQIRIPGYTSLTFREKQEVQVTAFKNPAENACYFRLTLSLEDGTQLWQSDLLEPGTTVTAIKLEKILYAGTYENCVLKYDCYTLDDSHTPLNGAQTKLTIKVK